ncbi:PREDICTED: 11-beta-hydroxysteroid dehydrogenase-like 4A [Tarenaya hassleriana]|uniref:11-beta-hydroxysteroid dehydrogenase-like 4A n=1 Tax=Tarenaya hassleriana TaxID=28532 RepID=UPI00053CA038|nr:PREDICTED: 11-beta-hydroxysteroid dehydrogenase-like 4A [Tarenaya hassleriana]
MDLVNEILNIVLPPLVFLSLFLLSPLLIFFNLLRRVQGFRNAEDVAGKVVIITGASSGIGEELAYEYARRGARITLVARREDRLRAVAEKSRQLGSPDVVVIYGDVSVVEDCKRFVQETINHFGQLDHLVNNAGIVDLKMFEDYSNISEAAARVMNTNFWGSVHATHFAIPHLKRTNGKIAVVSSIAGWSSPPYLSIYGASKAAMINFYETLRIEIGPEIGITIVTPGLIKTEIVNPELLGAMRGLAFFPAMSAGRCARGIVDGVCRRQRFVTEPSWFGVSFWVKTLCPDLMDMFYRFILSPRPKRD